MYTEFEIEAYKIYINEYFDEHDKSMCPVCMEEFCRNELENEDIRAYYEKRIEESHAKSYKYKNYLHNTIALLEEHTGYYGRKWLCEIGMSLHEYNSLMKLNGDIDYKCDHEWHNKHYGTMQCDKCGEIRGTKSDKCPLGSDIDCADCCDSDEHHFVNGECLRRDKV